MSRKDVRAAMGSKFVEFKKASFASNTTDAFDDEFIHVYYDDRDVVEAVEVFRPSQCTYSDIDLLDVPISRLKEALCEKGLAFITDESGLFIEDGRLGLYVPEEIDSPTAVATSVYVELPRNLR
jgi:hypothetical protein